MSPERFVKGWSERTRKDLPLFALSLTSPQWGILGGLHS